MLAERTVFPTAKVPSSLWPVEECIPRNPRLRRIWRAQILKKHGASGGKVEKAIDLVVN